MIDYSIFLKKTIRTFPFDSCYTFWMGVLTLLVIAIGLSMDAFAIAICTGLARKNYRLTDSLKTGAYFGVAQAVMPTLGFIAGGAFAERIARYDHWIAFALLAFIGVKMLIDSRSKAEEYDEEALRFTKMFPLAIATSIDALAVGLSFAFLNVNILPAACLIGATTFVLRPHRRRIRRTLQVLGYDCRRDHPDRHRRAHPA